MRRSVMDASARQELLDRLERLSPDAAPRWGTMSAPRMVAHLADWMLMIRGEIRTASRKGMLRYPPFKQLAIYWLPFPKGVPTSPELIGREPRDWDVERAAVREHLQWFEDRDPREAWPEHPAFAKISAAAWCVFAYRHMDHHL